MFGTQIDDPVTATTGTGTHLNFKKADPVVTGAKSHGLQTESESKP